MGDLNHEPSMEEILASIKRIIAEDGEGPPVPARRSPRKSAAGGEAGDRPAEAHAEDGVLELTDRVEEPLPQAAHESEEVPMAAADQVEVADAQPAPLVSPPAERASRDAIAALSAMVVRPETPGADSLEGLVRELLRPMLKDWLDARLPDVVEQIVQREIARIVGNR